MQSQATTPAQYVNSLPPERKFVIQQLRRVIKKNLPKGFAEMMGHGMMGYAVPHTLYPAGYHCDPKEPLPFIGLASQKHFVAVYHMGLYVDKKLLDWFTKKYRQLNKTKLDMGKSCLRFKKLDQIPYELIGELAGKVTVKQWIALYEQNLKR